ncbi:MAG: serine/threonine-protein phosphatase [Treponema sp.]|nr:serine/threonine-protein phosphatase [Treponema sp.]
MYKSRRRAALVLVYTIMTVVFILLAVFLVPQAKINDYRMYSNAFPVIVATFLFGSLLMLSSSLYKLFRNAIERNTMMAKETGLLAQFVDRLRFCYSLEDFTQAVADILEQKADCSVLYVDRKTNYVLYNSISHIASASSTLETVRQNFSLDWKDGVYFLGDGLGIVSNSRRARGFFIALNGQHLFIFCRYAHLFDNEMYPRLYEEFNRFQTRSGIITGLSEISELSQEWDALAKTQQSFLPPAMPDVKGVKLAAYFRPLINVSGDYYTVLPIDEHKTLVMLGDVSGKGLAAALVMGLVMNTVKIKENKEDLPGILQAVDASIKNMHLQDKYTVVFIGIIDTEKMTIRYINASMSDPIIVTRSPDGYRIKPLSSNCSIVGIIPLDDISVAEQRLFSGDLILMASDGVSEVMDENGVELGDTPLFEETIKKSASKDPQEFINDIEKMIMTYNGGKKLRDDVTMLVAKIQG